MYKPKLIIFFQNGKKILLLIFFDLFSSPFFFELVCLFDMDLKMKQYSFTPECVFDNIKKQTDRRTLKSRRHFSLIHYSKTGLASKYEDDFYVHHK